MKVGAADEWRVIERLLPAGCKDAARERGAFRRARYTADPALLLRLLLFHAVNDGGLREGNYAEVDYHAQKAVESTSTGRCSRQRGSTVLAFLLLFLSLSGLLFGAF